MEHRNFEIRKVDGEERLVRGIAVPYNETIEVNGFKERFERGAVGTPTDVKLFTEHKDPIGKVVSVRDTDAGVEVTARISSTPKGNEVYTLLQDGVLNRMSVGFVPKSHRMEGDVFVRQEVELKEVSVVAFPAYDGATISEVRHDAEDNTDVDNASEVRNQTKEDYEIMENENENNNKEQSDLNELRNSVEDLERRLTVINTSKGADESVRYRSAGEWMKAFFNGESEAKEMFTRSDTSDTHVQPAWVSERLRRRLDRRIVINAFDSQPLPNDGMSIEYPVISSETGDVAEQAAEGDTLALLGLVTGTQTASVKTYGGYTNVSKQVVDRAPTSYLSSMYEMMVNSYAKVTEAAARAALTGLAGVNTATLSADSVTAWIDLVVDAAGEIEDNGVGVAEFALCSRDVFKRLAHLTDSNDRPVFTVSGQGRNVLGSTDIVVPKLDIGGLPVYVDSSLAADSFYVADSSGLKTFESSGAPFELTDENITALTKDWSLYGYMAITTPHPTNIVKCDVDLVA